MKTSFDVYFTSCLPKERETASQMGKPGSMLGRERDKYCRLIPLYLITYLFYSCVELWVDSIYVIHQDEVKGHYKPKEGYQQLWGTVPAHEEFFPIQQTTTHTQFRYKSEQWCEIKPFSHGKYE